jgi:hypothetical protein
LGAPRSRLAPAHKALDESSRVLARSKSEAGSRGGKEGG